MIFILRKAQSFNLEIKEAIVRDEHGDEIGECEEKSECENVKPCYTVDYKMKIRERSKMILSSFPGGSIRTFLNRKVT